MLRTRNHKNPDNTCIASMADGLPLIMLQRVQERGVLWRSAIATDGARGARVAKEMA
jgi:hypothetical protein